MGCSVATLCVSLPIWGAGRVVLHKWGCFYLLIMPSLSCLLFACVWCREHLPAFAYLWGKRVEVRKTKFRRFLKLDAMICVTGICVLLIEPTRPAWFVVPGSISTFMLSEKTIADTTFLCVFLHILVPDRVSVSLETSKLLGSVWKQEWVVLSSEHPVFTNHMQLFLGEQKRFGFKLCTVSLLIPVGLDSNT